MRVVQLLYGMFDCKERKWTEEFLGDKKNEK